MLPEKNKHGWRLANVTYTKQFSMELNINRTVVMVMPAPVTKFMNTSTMLITPLTAISKEQKMNGTRLLNL